MRLSIVIGALCAMSVASSVSRADTPTLARAGNLEAFGGTASNGRPVCGVSQDVAGKYFGLKRFNQTDHFTIQIGSNGWKFQNGQKVKLEMVFDGNSPWSANGTGMHFDDGDPGLEFTVKRTELDRFLGEFQNGTTLKVRFIDATIADWTVSLAGSGVVSGVMQKCIRDRSL